MNGTKEVKPVIVLSPVNNCNFWHIFVASLSSGVISMFVSALHKKDAEH